MLFLNIEYYYFLIITAILFYLFNFFTLIKIRNGILLCASYFFYSSWRIEYGILLLISTLIDYFSAFKISREENPKKRKIFLILSISANLFLLIFFKYFLYFLKQADLLKDFQYFQSIPDYWFILPIGISFYTFQTMGYTIDVFRKRIQPEKSFIHFGLFVSFFPQLIAGPIEKAGILLPQLKNKVSFKKNNIIYGIKRIIRGLFKKIVIANTLSLYTDYVFNNPHEYQGLALGLAVFFFGNQVYCDFSGYADIAVGSARIFGINIMENFRFPILSRTITDFWSRWHISLSNWFKEYAFPYFAPKNSSKTRILFSVVIILLLSGIWHGARISYLIWGAVFSFYFVTGALIGKYRRKFLKFIFPNPNTRKFFEICFTLLLTTISATFFRANSAADAFYIVTNTFRYLPEHIYMLFTTAPAILYNTIFEIPDYSSGEFLLSVIIMLLTGPYEIYFAKYRISDYFSEKICFSLRFIFYTNLIFLIILFTKINPSAFIYFKF